MHLRLLGPGLVEGDHALVPPPPPDITTCSRGRSDQADGCGAGDKDQRRQDIPRVEAPAPPQRIAPPRFIIVHTRRGPSLPPILVAGGVPPRRLPGDSVNIVGGEDSEAPKEGCIGQAWGIRARRSCVGVERAAQRPRQPTGARGECIARERLGSASKRASEPASASADHSRRR